MEGFLAGLCEMHVILNACLGEAGRQLKWNLAKHRKKQKLGLCVYCGRQGVVTENHIPPKALFQKAAHASLLRIPSCVTCNTGASKDDEYLRTMIALSAKGERNASFDTLVEKTVRSLVRPEAAHFRESIMRGLSETFIPSPAGVLVPAVLGDVDLSRFDKVIARIIKGIFFDERGRRLHSDYEVVSYSTAGLTRVSVAVGQRLQSYIGPLLARDPKQIGGPEFLYWSDYNPSDIDQSWWILLIHRHHSFIGWTVEREHATPAMNARAK